ncbi:MAG: hypothetical protein ACYCU0_01340 [Solirubrobacteraceae bacterium]
MAPSATDLLLPTSHRRAPLVKVSRLHEELFVVVLLAEVTVGLGQVEDGAGIRGIRGHLGLQKGTVAPILVRLVTSVAVILDPDRGAGLTFVDTVTATGTATGLVGAAPTVTHTSATGEYTLTFATTSPNLATCAIVVTSNETAAHTADAKATGEHGIAVYTYAGTTAGESAFSLMVTC